MRLSTDLNTFDKNFTGCFANVAVPLNIAAIFLVAVSADLIFLIYSDCDSLSSLNVNEFGSSDILNAAFSLLVRRIPKSLIAIELESSVLEVD